MKVKAAVKIRDDKLAEYRRFAKLSKAYLHPPGSYRTYGDYYTRYQKANIMDMLNAPEKNERGLRKASMYMYDMSSHYRRLINYFAKLPTYDFYVSPLKVSARGKLNQKSFQNCYRKAVDQVELMNLKHEMMKIAITCFREDVFFGYEYMTKDSYFIKKLNADYCRLLAIEDGVYTFEFDFSYFDTRQELLEFYGTEFQNKYAMYKSDRNNMKWQELDTNCSVCIKLNEDETHIIPPFAGTFPDIFDIADYKALMKAKTEQQNYKLLTMRIPFKNGRPEIPESLAISYYDQLGEELPERIGLALTPMDIDSIDFDKSSVNDVDTVAQSENNFFRASGTSNLIMGNEKLTSSSALMLSIEADAALTYGLLRQMERWINRKLKRLTGTYHFKLTFLNTTIYNRDKVQQQLVQAAQYSFPVKFAAASAFGLTPSDVEGLIRLENSVIGLQDLMIPVVSTHTQSSDDGGRPASDTVDESGELTQENDSNANR